MFKVFQKIANSDHKYGLVMEDDVVIPEDFKKKVDETIMQAPQNWDMILICPYSLLEKPRSKRVKRTVTFIRARWILFSAYVISKKMAKALLLKAFPVRRQVRENHFISRTI